MSKAFYPSSLSFIKKSAKQLQRAFPSVSLSVAQEATSVALGFTCWFDASQRIKAWSGKPSLPDEEIQRDEVLQRRYQQIRALIDVANLPPCEVDYFVRCWNLTASAPATRLKDFETDFDTSDGKLKELEAGSITDEELETWYGYNGVPQRVGEGIIHGPAGYKHNYIQLSSARLQEMPIYLRGNQSLFLDFEEGGFVALAFPDCFNPKAVAKGWKFLESHEHWLYEWHTGKRPDGFHGLSIAEMVKKAMEYPDDWMALSVRTPNEDRRMQTEDEVVPAIKGSDFVRFIATKGSLRGCDLRWFQMKDNRAIERFFAAQWGEERIGLTPSIRFTPEEAVEVEPMYGSPFKHGPMWSSEYEPNTEGGGMLLSDELEEDVEDDPETANLTTEEIMEKLAEAHRIAVEAARSRS